MRQQEKTMARLTPWFSLSIIPQILPLSVLTLSSLSLSRMHTRTIVSFEPHDKHSVALKLIDGCLVPWWRFPSTHIRPRTHTANHPPSCHTHYDILTLSHTQTYTPLYVHAHTKEVSTKEMSVPKFRYPFNGRSRRDLNRVWPHIRAVVKGDTGSRWLVLSPSLTRFAYCLVIPCHQFPLTLQPSALLPPVRPPSASSFSPRV